MAYGTDDSPGHEGDRVHYMALGGRHQYQTVDEEPGVAHYCGTPQGRGPTETGPHGCTVVHVDDTGRARPQFVATDSIRWTEQTLEVTATTKQEQLYERLVERMEKLLAKHPGIDLLGALEDSRDGAAGESVAAERAWRTKCSSICGGDLARARRSAWSASLECHSPLSVPAEWYDEETVLGDFVRQVRACEKDESLPFESESVFAGERARRILGGDCTYGKCRAAVRPVGAGGEARRGPADDSARRRRFAGGRISRMKIADLRIDGFGVWHDLTLRGLSPEVTVFYGPNEAGKSTLMNFLRTVLYGVTPSRRKRYLPPLVGRPTGRLAQGDGRRWAAHDQLATPIAARTMSAK